MAKTYSEVQEFLKDFTREFNNFKFHDKKAMGDKQPMGETVNGVTYKTPIEELYEKFCRMKFSFCENCEPICEVNIFEPCEDNWSPLVETCCDICDIKCEAECFIQFHTSFHQKMAGTKFLVNLINLAIPPANYQMSMSMKIIKSINRMQRSIQTVHMKNTQKDIKIMIILKSFRLASVMEG